MARASASVRQLKHTNSWFTTNQFWYPSFVSSSTNRYVSADALVSCDRNHWKFSHRGQEIRPHPQPCSTAFGYMCGHCSLPQRSSWFISNASSCKLNSSINASTCCGSGGPGGYFASYSSCGRHGCRQRGHWLWLFRFFRNSGSKQDAWKVWGTLAFAWHVIVSSSALKGPWHIPHSSPSPSESESDSSEDELPSRNACCFRRISSSTAFCRAACWAFHRCLAASRAASSWSFAFRFSPPPARREALNALRRPWCRAPVARSYSTILPFRRSMQCFSFSSCR